MTVSVLVAAGVAVYNSPQFQEWMSSSRRKLAVALHNLGDEINPRDSPGDDISMTEEASEAAEERRRIARAEILRRASLLEALHNRSQDPNRPLDSFDTLVDKDGNLILARDVQAQVDGDIAQSSAIDTGSQQPVRRGINKDILEGINTGESGLLLDVSSETLSHHPSESDLQFTPTSEAPGDLLFDPFAGSPIRARSPISASSHTEGNDEYYYTHPHPASNDAQQSDLESDLGGSAHGNNTQHGTSPTPSTAGSFSYVHELTDAASDGTQSEFGVHSIGIATPASWSEVGSVVSDNDAGHQ